MNNKRFFTNSPPSLASGCAFSISLISPFFALVQFYFSPRSRINPFANVAAGHNFYPVVAVAVAVAAVPCALSHVALPPSFAARSFHADDGRCSCDSSDC